MEKTHDGYLLIADITGYTKYLNEFELEHAQETLTALLELLVDNTRSPLIISRLAGDAVISYGLLQDFFTTQTFLEKIEDIYITFRKAIERLVLNNTCQCNACANISTLDLKYFVHYGTFGLQHISEFDELVGSDINLLHRLLKNTVTEDLGYRAYALFTKAAINKLGAEIISETMARHTEDYEHLGQVEVLVQDLHPVWESRRNATTTKFPQDRLLDRSDIQINVPLEQTWDYLIQPEFRNTLVGTDRIVLANRSNGRAAPGSIYQCYHGEDWLPQLILEWQPFERMLTKETFSKFGNVNAIIEYRLDLLDNGTRLTRLIARPTGKFLGLLMFYSMVSILSRMGRRNMQAFKEEIEKDYMTHHKEVRD